jgi:hypothetical protein
MAKIDVNGDVELMTTKVVHVSWQSENAGWGEVLRLAQITPKAQWLLYVPPCLTFNNSTFCPHSVFMFCVDLRTNSEYFTVQN